MKMKKIVLAVALVAMVSCFASCKKTCTCTTYAAGASSTSEVELSELQEQNASIKKCSDMNTVVTVAGISAGVECK